jgi:uncharacterized protein
MSIVVSREEVSGTEMEFTLSLDKIVLQPTTLCNLNCSYCYLPQRKSSSRMSPEITSRLAESIRDFKQHLTLVWHGGEPLTCGLKHFSDLLQPLIELNRQQTITHSIQTNATLIDDDWCKLFTSHEFHVGVSIDGPIWANRDRVDWQSKESFSRAIKGITLLKQSAIDFHVIAVVSSDSLPRAKEFYDFFCELGCRSVGINIEEREGVNLHREMYDDSRVMQFWKDLFEAWRANPIIRIREFAYLLSWMKAVGTDLIDHSSTKYVIDILPTIAWNGDVVLLSPELLGTRSAEYNDFVVGNLKRELLETILTQSMSVKYVSDFLAGVRKCRDSCSYFSFCGGGQASNKFYETGSIDSTETAFCRNSKQRLVHAVLNVL